MELSRAITFVAGFLLSAGLVQNISGQAETPAPVDLTQASLEDLMDITVTSVSKKEQKLSQAAAAVFVITQEDIRRSGAANISDVLRMAPGVNVARVDALRKLLLHYGLRVPEPPINEVFVSSRREAPFFHLKVRVPVSVGFDIEKPADG